MLTIHLWDGWIPMTMPLQNRNLHCVFVCSVFAYSAFVCKMPVWLVFVTPICIFSCQNVLKNHQMLNMGQKLLKQTTFFLFDSTLSYFIHVTKIWFVKPFFDPYFEKVFFWTSGKKGYFWHFSKTSQTNHQKRTYFCFVCCLLYETLLNLP